MDISDPLTLLGFLFLGTVEKLNCGNGTGSDPGNIELLDCNGDRKIDLSDSVCVLQFLFSGGPPHVGGTECKVVELCPPACK